MTVLGEIAVNAVVLTEGVQRGARVFRQEIGAMAEVAMNASGKVAAVGLAASAAAYELVSSQGQIADATDRVSQKLELGVERLSQLRYAAKMTADMADGTLDAALERMNTNVGLAAHGSGKAAKSIAELGLSAAYLSTLDTDRKLNLIADALERFPMQDRVRITEKIFGNGDIALVLQKGRQGLADLATESDRTGATLGQLANDKLAAADNSIDRMHKSVDGLKHALAGALAPAVSNVADATADFISGFTATAQVYDAETSKVQLQNRQLEINANARAKVNEQMNAAARANGMRTVNAIQEAGELDYRQLTSDIANLRSQVDQAHRGNETFGMSDLDKAKFDRSHHMKDRALNDQLIQELEIREKLEATRKKEIEAKEHDQRLDERAASIIEQNLTPLEQLQKKLTELQELQAAGKLDATQFGRAIGEAHANYNAAVSGGAVAQQSPLAAVKFGSSEAQRAIAESRNQDKNKVPAETLEEIKKGNALTKGVIDAIKAKPSPPTASWS